MRNATASSQAQQAVTHNLQSHLASKPGHRHWQAGRKLVARNKLAAEKFATHHFSFDQFIEAYDTFSRAAETQALKVVISRS